MLKEADIVQTALEHLKNTAALKGKWIPVPPGKANGHDGKVDILFADKKETLFVEVKKELRHHHIAALAKQARQYAPFMLIAYKIFPAIKEELRKHNIAYLDGAGNIYLKTPRHYIWIDGQKDFPAAADPVNRAFTKTGLKVVFQFLIQDELLNAPYRLIADTAGTALGNINLVIGGLKEQGFVKNLDDKRLMLVNKAKLLERWVTAYGERLKPGLHMGNFRFMRPVDEQNWNDIAFKAKDTMWGGEPAADILTQFLQPQVWTIYTTETKQDLIRNYRLVPDPQGNIHVYKKFWKITQLNKNIVPPLLIYADLINSGDPRNIEVAQRVFDRFVKEQVGL